MYHSALLQQLTAQFNLLVDKLQPIVTHPCLYSRFSPGLFSAHARYLRDYVSEARNTLWRLSQTVTQQTEKSSLSETLGTGNSTDKADWLAQRLLAQMQALHSEAISWSLRYNDFNQRSAGRLYHHLLQLQQQRQRLLALADESAGDNSPTAQDERTYLQHLLEKNHAAMQQVWQKLQRRACRPSRIT